MRVRTRNHSSKIWMTGISFLDGRVSRAWSAHMFWDIVIGGVVLFLATVLVVRVRQYLKEQNERERL